MQISQEIAFFNFLPYLPVKIRVQFGHIQSPIRFDSDLKVTIQDSGWYCGGRYLRRNRILLQ
jgi:hypothetical protein